MDLQYGACIAWGRGGKSARYELHIRCDEFFAQETELPVLFQLCVLYKMSRPHRQQFQQHVDVDQAVHVCHSV